MYYYSLVPVVFTLTDIW